MQRPSTLLARTTARRYRKLYARLRRAIQSSARDRRTTRRKHSLLTTLQRYERRLQRAGVAVAATAALFAAPEVLQAQATPAGGEVQVNTFTTGSQQNSATAMDADGDYIVVWEGEGQSDSEGIFAQRYQADGIAVGGAFRVNSYTTSDQRNPAVAMDADGDFVVAWQSLGQDGSENGIFARRYQADGTALDASDVQINVYTTSQQQNPSVAMDADGDFVVAWESLNQDGSNYGVFARRYQADGTALDADDVQINIYTTSQQKSSSVAMDADGDFIVAWESRNQDGSSYGVFARRYNANGTALDNSDVQINAYTSSRQEDPSVAMDTDGNYVVAWMSGNAYGTQQDGDKFGIYARRYQADGTALDASDVQINTYTTNTQRFPSVAMDATGDFVVAWESGYYYGSGNQDGDLLGVFARRFHADGTALDPSDIQVNTYTTSYQRAASVAMDADGNFVVAWQSRNQDGSNWGIYAQRYEAPAPPVSFTERVPIGSETQVNTYTTANQLFPDVATDADGDYVIVWQGNQQDGFGYGVFGQRFDTDGTAAGMEFRVNIATAQNQDEAAVAMDAAGNFIVVWESSDDDENGIFARRYQADGTALDAGDVRINVTTQFNQTTPTVAMDAAGNYVVAWTSGTMSNGDEILYRRFLADGTALDAADVSANTYTTGVQMAPSAAMDANGNFVIAWESNGQDGDDNGIYARRFQDDGTALDMSDVQINTITTDSQDSPSVAMDADGNFVVTWKSSGTDGDSNGIFARRFQADGTALDVADVQVNTYTTGSQERPDVSVDADGDYVIVWESAGQDGDGLGTYLQQYSADGTPAGGETRVNTSTQTQQGLAAVAMEDNGEFVVAFANGDFTSGAPDPNGDGFGLGIFAQRFGDATLPVELADLRATALARTNLLAWTTATESANEGFAVQRSYDGKQWEVIGWVEGAGESYDATAYTYEDMQPREGVTYYRLEQLDYDGTATLSEVVSVVRMEDEVSQELRAYPNPVSGLLTVENAGAELHLYALTGQLILTKATNGDDRATLDMNGLAEGVYLLTTTLESGEVRQVRLMVK